MFSSIPIMSLSVPITITIAARVPDYKQEWLTGLQEDGRIFEFFTSDSGYIPIARFPLSLSVKQGFFIPAENP